MPAMMRSLSSCFEATRMCRSTERANLEKKPSIEPRAVFGCEGELEPAPWLGGEPCLRLFGDMGRMIIEDQLDRCIRRICGVEKFEDFYELPAAVTVSDQGMDFTGQQIDPGQEAEGPVAFIFMLARESRM